MKIILAILICATGMTMSSAYVVSSLVSVGGNEIPTIYNDINDYIDSNPDVKLIPMNIVSNGYNASRSYSLGTRQTGDVVVANVNSKKSWPVAQNVTTTLTYPSTGGNGAYLTYVLINVEQASNLGQAYVSYGGVHQHFIQIIVEARITTYFNYAAFFYGIK